MREYGKVTPQSHIIETKTEALKQSLFHSHWTVIKTSYQHITPIEQVFLFSGYICIIIKLSITQYMP